jgi:hypothetical protein
MKRWLILGGVALGAAYVAYAGAQLIQHGAECNSAYRHCPVPPERLATLMGAWCNAPDVARAGPVREVLTRAGEHVEARRVALATGASETVRQRYVLDTGRVSYREYDLANDRPVDGGRVEVRLDGERRVTRFHNVDITWVRCDRMAEAGVPAAVQALFR